VTALALLAEATAAGLALRVEGDSLRIRPPDRLTPELREKLQALKPELLAVLGARQQAAGAAWAAAFGRLRACGWPGAHLVALVRPDLQRTIAAAEGEAERLTAAYRAGAVELAAFVAGLDGWEVAMREAAVAVTDVCSDCGTPAAAMMGDPSTGERWCVRCWRAGVRP
jgi:hypothetical protein